MDGVNHVREKLGADSIDLWILSAGYGFIPGDREIVPYECTFASMKVAELQDWANHLRSPGDARRIFDGNTDMPTLGEF